MAQSVLRDKAKAFAKEIVFLCRQIKAIHKETVLTNQLLRSGTSIGAIRRMLISSINTVKPK